MELVLFLGYLSLIVVIFYNLKKAYFNILYVLKRQNRREIVGNVYLNGIYSKKELMSNFERYFYNVLIELEDELDIKIHPQINLATIIKKEINNYYINELFRNVDFAIFDKDYKNILLLIELNDKTHSSKRRISRDLKVEKIVNQAGIKLIKFYSNYPNEKNYIKNRIRKEISKI